MNRSPRIWVVTELYYPEETSTGYLLTMIAEGLARNHDVRVLCAQPTYSSRGLRVPSREDRHGVRIRRCWSTTFDRTSLPLRVVNMLTISLSILFNAIVNFSRGDVVLVVTNPPLMPFLVSLASGLKGAKCLLLVHDVYPDALIVAGLARPRSMLTRVLERANRWLYRRMDAIIALGRDMKELVERKLGENDDRVTIIPNWADLDLVSPLPREDNPLIRDLGIEDRFILQYAGNMGRTHGLEDLVDAARSLEGRSRAHFIFIGSGAKAGWVREQASPLENVTFVGSLSRSDQPVFLNACDVAVISFMPGMAGVSVPSRMYNIMASGKPILAVADPSSELWRVVEEERIGWVVAPGDAQRISEAIRQAEADSAEWEQMGRRARAAVERRFSYDVVRDAYDELVDDYL